MNERIKEIASQVLDELVPETWVALGYDKIKEIQFRTAELIVAECITVVQNTPRHCAYTTFQESIVDCTIDLSVQSIEQHFSIKGIK